MDGTAPGLYLDPRLMAPRLSESERALREQFAYEYVKDFDPVLACVRLGFHASFAVAASEQFLGEPYVQQLIAGLRRSQPSNEKVSVDEDRALVLSVLRQAAQNGPYVSRVQAASKLATILGLDRQDKAADGTNALVEALRDFAKVAPV